MAEPLRKESRVDDVERENVVADLCRRYVAGESIRALAGATGRSYASVRRALAQGGVTIRRGRAAAVVDDLVRRGIAEPPRARKEDVPLPKRRPMPGGGSLSDVVIELRG